MGTSKLRTSEVTRLIGIMTRHIFWLYLSAFFSLYSTNFDSVDLKSESKNLAVLGEEKQERDSLITVTDDNCKLSCEKEGWEDFYDLNRNNLESLFNNQISAIRVQNFLTEEECEKISLFSQNGGFDLYENVFPPIGRIGITQFESSGKEKSTYFEKVREANEKRKRICEFAGVDVLQRVKDVVQSLSDLNVEVAQEPSGGRYFAGY